MPKTRKKKCKFCGTCFTPAPQAKIRQKCCGAPACKKQRIKESQQQWHEKNPTYFHNRYENTKACLLKRPGYLIEFRKNNPDYVENNRRQQRKRDQRRKSRNLDIQDSAFLQDQLDQRDTHKLRNLDIQEPAFPYLLLLLGLTSELRHLDIQEGIDIQLPKLYNRGRFLYRQYVDT